MPGLRRAPNPIRIYLTGRVSIESGGRILDQDAFPGNQGCLLFARLVVDRHHAVGRSDLAEALWAEKRPRAWEVALAAILSKLRLVLGRAGLSKSEVLSSALGCYQLQLPRDAWIDVEAAADAIHEAEIARRAGRRAKSYGPAHVAYQITRRPFFAGEDSPWVDERREKLRTIFVRSCECLSDFYIWNGEPSLAVEAAKQVVAREPYRETGYQLLMRAHEAAGNRAEALWTYERCRKLISEELGADPSPATRAIHQRLLAPP
jgi:DNA-binding SARP family transcriptional activator